MSSKTKNKRKEAKVETKNLAPVQDAVRDYRVIEDGAYAYHLQEAEIENHYAQNVNMRKIVQDDIRRAKALQDEEDRKARIRTLDEEEEVKQMDEELAEMIQEEIYMKSAREEQERNERKERDGELALLMEETERRRQEHAKRYEKRDFELAERLQNVNVTPPASRDERRMRLMPDEELAKRLQEEEKLKAEHDKKRKEQMKSVVELQDEELAKYIHDKEIEAAEYKFRKEKERRRKSKKKGKWDDEPLYYDDNVPAPPDGYPNDPRNHHPHEHRREVNSRVDDPRGMPPEYQVNDDPRRRPADDRRHRKDDKRRPERPPPPKFDDSHNTEIKVPLDDSQRKSKDRHSSRPSPAQEYSRDYGRDLPSHHHSRGGSEKNRRLKGSADSLDMGEPHRSYSEKPRTKHDHERRHGSSHSHPRHDDSRDHHSGRDHGRERHQDPWQRHEPERPRSRQENGQPKPKPRGAHINHSNSNPEFGMKHRK